MKYMGGRDRGSNNPIILGVLLYNKIGGLLYSKSYHTFHGTTRTIMYHHFIINTDYIRLPCPQWLVWDPLCFDRLARHILAGHTLYFGQPTQEVFEWAQDSQRN